MKKNLNQQNFLSFQNLIVSFIIMYMVAPIVSRAVSTYLSTYLYMLLIVFFVLYVFMKLENQDSNKLFILLVPFGIYQLLTFFFNTGDIFIWGYRVLLFLLPVIFGYFMITRAVDDIPSIAKVSFWTFAITAVTTILGLVRHPGASRIIATFADSQDADAIKYGWENIGGYEFVYMVVLLYPLVILAHKRGKINLFTTILLSVSILVLVVYSEYTTGLLLFIITSLLHFMKKDLKTRNIVFLTIASIVIVLFFSDFLMDLVGNLAEMVNSETMSERLEALAGGKKGLEESEDNRLELYMMSIYWFFDHVLLGSFISGYSEMGGHSFILDTLANYGLLGGTFMYLMYRNVYTTFYAKYKNCVGYGYVLWLFIQTLILSTINTMMWLEVLALFAPLFLHCIYKEEESNNEDTVDSEHSVGTTRGKAGR